MADKALKVDVANNTAKAKLGYHAEVDIGGKAGYVECPLKRRVK